MQFDFLSDSTRKVRKPLLFISFIGFTVSIIGLRPSEISIFGTKFITSNFEAIPVILFLVNLYFLVSFIFYGFSDFLDWKIQASKETIRGEDELHSQDLEKIEILKKLGEHKNLVKERLQELFGKETFQRLLDLGTFEEWLGKPRTTREKKIEEADEEVKEEAVEQSPILRATITDHPADADAILADEGGISPRALKLIIMELQAISDSMVEKYDKMEKASREQSKLKKYLRLSKPALVIRGFIDFLFPIGFAIYTSILLLFYTDLPEVARFQQTPELENLLNNRLIGKLESISIAADSIAKDTSSTLDKNHSKVE